MDVEDNEKEIISEIDKIIDKAFFSEEKISLKDTLKKISSSKFKLSYFLMDILKNHSIKSNPEIEINLETLVNSKILKKPKGLSDVVYINLLTNLKKHLDAFFVIINQKLKNLDPNEFQEAEKILEKNKELIRKRFNYYETKDVTTVFVEKEFNGQASFVLKKHLKTTEFLTILKELRSKGFVINETTTDKFMNIFSGNYLTNEERVNWSGTRKELYLFVRNLKPKLTNQDSIYDTAIRCFTINNKEITKPTELYKAGGKTLQEKELINIASLF